MMCANKTDGLFELTACIFGTAERRMLLGRLRHFRIGIGKTAEAVEVEPPAMEPGCRKFIAPRTAIEAMGDR